MIPKSYDLDKWVAKYFVSKDETYRDTEKRKKDTEKCTIQYLFSMSVSFPYHFSIFSVSEFFIEHLEPIHDYFWSKHFSRKFFTAGNCGINAMIKDLPKSVK